jgi:mannose-6-phosphate isomerase-like protein (cupin superfamily)
MSLVLSPAQWLARLPGEKGERFVLAFEHGTLSVELYAPRGTDPQQPHARDEAYVVVSGSGTFVHGTARESFKAGDFFVVPAGVVHRFEDFSDDFATWVIFYDGELESKISTPVGVNVQDPHTRDEIYVCIRGRGTLVHGERRDAFEAGDLMFVERGLGHHFEDFTDLAVWVFFFS